MAKNSYIKKPNDVKINNGSFDAKLIWSKDFGKQRNGGFQAAQKFIDSECIRLMSSYTPKQNGILVKSATLGTKIGSGKIEQVAPYARYQYYGMLMVSSVTGSAWAKHGESKVLTDKPLNYHGKNPKGGKMWFERMKADHKDAILRGAARISGGKVK